MANKKKTLLSEFFLEDRQVHREVSHLQKIEKYWYSLEVNGIY